MVDKPRKPRRPGDGPAAGFRGAGAGRGGERTGRPAGKPARGPARPRITGGIDPRALEVLEREGLLTEAGRKFRGGGGPARVASQEAPARPRGGAKLGAPRAAGPGGASAPALRPKLQGPVKTAAPGKGRRGNPAETAVAERLHKVMAQAGVASRRHSEELIQAGRVTVNGQVVTELGTKVVPGRDRVEVDGRSLGRPENLVHILMNKPKGYVTTLYDPEGRRKVVDLLGGEIGERVYPVGRLDYDTEGLLLLTNDGELANALMHPAKMVKKTYIAKLRGVVAPAKIKALESGIELEDGLTAPAELKMIDVAPPNACTVSIRIHEGRNRQVRRMFEAVGHEVIHLKRTTLGPLHLRDLEVGQWRNLTQQEVNDVRKAAGLKPIKLEGEAGPARTTARPHGRRGAARITGGGQVRGRMGAPAEAGGMDEEMAPARPRRVGAGPSPFEPREADGPRKVGGPRVGAAGPRAAAGARFGGDGPRAAAGPRFGDGPRMADGPRKPGGPRAAGGPRFGEGPRSEGGARKASLGAPRPAASGTGFKPARKLTQKGPVTKNRSPK